MKQVIKIGLILIALGAIAFFIWKTMSGMGDAPEIDIKNKAFYQQVDDRVKAEVNNKVPYAKAEQSYKDIVAMIETEYAQNSKNPEMGINNDDRKGCLRNVTQAFAPLFVEHGQQYFHSSNWDASQVNALRSTALSLQQSDFIKGGSDVAGSLSQIIGTADSYGQAIAACNVGSCTSPEAVRSAIARADSYKKAPLTNDNNLMAKLNAVPEAAKSSYANYVVSYCQGIASRCTDYGSYEAWKGNRELAYNKITEYTNAFGQNPRVLAMRDVLSRAEAQADEYYD